MIGQEQGMLKPVVEYGSPDWSNQNSTELFRVYHSNALLKIKPEKSQSCVHYETKTLLEDGVMI